MHINEIFEKYAKRQPFSKAVAYHNEWMTYQELGRKANQFSHYFQSIHKIKSGNVVDMAVENKDINLLIAVLGILKTGVAYQPPTTNHHVASAKSLTLE